MFKTVPFKDEFESQVVDLIVSIQQEEFDIDITAERQPDLRSIPSFYQHGAGNFWVALDGDRVVGTTPFFHAAHRFYEKHGFASISKSELPSTFPVMEVDTKFYRLDLD